MAITFGKFTKSILTATLLTLAAAATSTFAAPPAVLEQIPADAKAVVVIGNVKSLGAKASNVAVRLNLPAPPELAGWATRMLNINKGFDFNGSAAMVLLSVP